MSARNTLKISFILLLFGISALSKAQNISNIHNELDSIRLVKCPQASFSFWAESINDSLTNYTAADSLWPTASAIKLFILPAFYQEFKSIWNSSPDQLDSILDFQPPYQKPLNMFSDSQITVIGSVLSGFTYKQIAEGMMGKGSLGNASYNACANIAIFLLGGPSATTSRIHSLHPDLSGLRIGRYMLEPRTDSTDNINRMEDFATLVRMFHYQNIPILQAADYPEIYDCIWSGTYNGYTYYQKSGGLTSAPSLRSRVGFIINGQNTLIYALNLVAFNGTSQNFAEARTEMTLLLRDKLLETFPVSSDNILVEPEITIFPNPAYDNLYIKTKDDVLMTTIYNPLGEIVLVECKHPIDISSLSSGIYIAKVTTRNNITVSLRFIKE